MHSRAKHDSLLSKNNAIARRVFRERVTDGTVTLRNRQFACSKGAMMGIWVGCQRLILGIDCFPLVASMKASRCSLQLIKQWSTAEQVNTTLCKWKEVCGDFRTVWIHTSSLSSTLAALTIPESVSLPLYLFTLLSQRSCWFSCFSRQFWSFQTLSQFPSAHWAVTEWLA